MKNNGHKPYIQIFCWYFSAPSSSAFNACIVTKVILECRPKESNKNAVHVTVVTWPCPCFNVCKYVNYTDVVLFVVVLNCLTYLCFRPYYSTMEYQNRMLCRNICWSWRTPWWSTWHCKLNVVRVEVRKIIGLYNLYWWL